jgi:hypothetical protein
MPSIPGHNHSKMAWLGPIVATLEQSIRTRKYQRILREDKECRNVLKSNQFVDDEAEDDERCGESTDDEAGDERVQSGRKRTTVPRKPKKHSKHKTKRKKQCSKSP